MDTTKVKTTYWRKPIPTDSFDWQATFEYYEGGHPMGHGYSELEAIKDLLAQIEEPPLTVEIRREVFSEHACPEQDMPRYYTRTI